MGTRVSANEYTIGWRVARRTHDGEQTVDVVYFKGFDAWTGLPDWTDEFDVRRRQKPDTHNCLTYEHRNDAVSARRLLRLMDKHHWFIGAQPETMVDKYVVVRVVEARRGSRRR